MHQLHSTCTFSVRLHQWGKRSLGLGPNCDMSMASYFPPPFQSSSQFIKKNQEENFQKLIPEVCGLILSGQELSLPLPLP